MKTYRVIVAGGRGFSDFKTLCKLLDKLLANKIEQGYHIVIVSGGAKGADSLGEDYADLRGLEKDVMKANWKDITTPPVSIGENQYGKYNKLAGMVRNHSMGDCSDALVLFWDGLSSGSQDMLVYMRGLKKPVRVQYY